MESRKEAEMNRDGTSVYEFVVHGPLPMGILTIGKCVGIAQAVRKGLESRCDRGDVWTALGGSWEKEAWWCGHPGFKAFKVPFCDSSTKGLCLARSPQYDLVVLDGVGVSTAKSYWDVGSRWCIWLFVGADMVAVQELAGEVGRDAILCTDGSIVLMPRVL
jgi:hypothetical protein